MGVFDKWLWSDKTVSVKAEVMHLHVFVMVILSNKLYNLRLSISQKFLWRHGIFRNFSVDKIIDYYPSFTFILCMSFDKVYMLCSCVYFIWNSASSKLSDLSNLLAYMFQNVCIYVSECLYFYVILWLQEKVWIVAAIGCTSV